MRRAHHAGLRQIVVTNRDHTGMDLGSPRYIVETGGMQGYIDRVFCGDDCEHRKPRPEVLGSYLQDAGISGEDCLVIGDQFVDAQFARNIGASSVLVTHYDPIIPHLDRLDDEYRRQLTIVPSLDSLVVI